MNEPKNTKSAPTRPETQPLPGDRKERLKSALKENLKRRKAQGRARTVESPADDKGSQSD